MIQKKKSILPVRNKGRRKLKKRGKQRKREQSVCLMLSLTMRKAEATILMS